ncbi:MAG: hypothetical protein LBO74_17655 [Candidatus Symbiothrix sp.]|jgi:hypothetical protein|nr:hypothetical protein [Candidatus Symbiothrix sp.]
MKKSIILFLIPFFWVGCHNNKEAAQSQLAQARSLYETAQYGSAKQLLDELKVQYPKELGVQKEALHLMREIEWAEQERNLFFCDSVLIVRQAEADSMKPYFVFEKTEYDNIGRYVDKSWNPSVGAASNYLKTSVNELAETVLTSVYSGGAIRYNQLKVANSSGEYAETEAIPFDGGANYSFQDATGRNYQIVTFQKGRDNGVIEFIYHYAGEKITMEYAGGKKKASIVLSNKEKNALVRTVDFATVLTDIENFKKEKDKAQKRMDYLHSKITH